VTARQRIGHIIAAMDRGGSQDDAVLAGATASRQAERVPGRIEFNQGSFGCAGAVWPRTMCSGELHVGARGREPTMADNIELIMRFHPVGGEDISVLSTDFASKAEALEAIARALDGQRSLVLAHARYNREAGENAMVINLANVVSVRVSSRDSDATGQYL
jgi:hypothetical protein